VKKLAFIALILTLFAPNSWASHVLGGEITYKHVVDKKYDVTLVVYRNCNECLLDGQGGGASTKNCNKPSLEMRLSSNGTCSGNAIGLIPITRIGIHKILPSCESTITKCEDNSNFAYGIEAHTYIARIDFAKYNKYNSCGFDLFLRATDRSSEISNVSIGANAKFYNYTYIFPWVNHNSPQLNENPQLLLLSNKTFTTNILKSSETDSISITSEAPMEGKDVYSKYNTNYSKETPLMVWCPSGNCSPDRRTIPLKGFYMDDLGNIAFTPTKSSENALVVYQIEKWRKIKGKMTKLSTVRRDVQHMVISGKNNSPVFADTTEKHFACIGAELCKDIKAYDAHSFSGGRPLPSDTVKFSWTTDLPNAAIKSVSTDAAPYYKLQVCWTPTKSDFRDEPYFIRIDIQDDACPVNARASKIITIQTRKNPEIDPIVELLNCGFIGVNSKLNTTSYTTEQWLLRNSNKQLIASSNKGLDTLQAKTGGAHYFEYKATDKFGCKSEFRNEFVLIEDFVNPRLVEPIIPFEVCDGEDFTVQLVQINGSDDLTAKWLLGMNVIGELLTLKHSASLAMNNDALSVDVSRIQDNLKCLYSVDVDIKVKAPPKIHFWDNKNTCFGDLPIDLNIDVEPKGGSWYSVENLINLQNQFITDKWPINSKGGSYSVRYSLLDPESGCTGTKNSTIHVHPIPDIQVEDVTICRLNGHYSLTSSLTTQEADLTYSWFSVDNSVGIFDGDKIDLASMNSGNYHFECRAESATGCINSIKFTITILHTAKIEYNETRSVCGTNGTMSLDELLDISPKGGSWFDNDLQEYIKDGLVPADFCGELNVNYTYNQEGCFDSKNITVDIICRPKIEITTPNKICKNIIEFKPTATPPGGLWSGTDVRNGNIVLPQNLTEFELVYTYNHNGCSFEETTIIELTEAPEVHISNVPVAICEGEIFTVNEPIGTSKNWLLFRSGLPFPGVKVIPTNEEIDKGKVSLELRAEGEGLCNTFVENYEILIHPSPSIDLSGIQKGCVPYDLKFSPNFANSRIDPKGVSVVWNFNDPNSSKNTSTNLLAKHRYDESGSYTLSVKLLSDKGCSFEKDATGFVEVFEKPTAYFTSTPNNTLSITDPIMQFSNRSSCKDEMRYIWDFGTDNPDNISYKKDPTYEFPKDTGSFTITLTAISDKQCFSSFSKDIYINPDIRLFIPTGFTPNGRGPSESDVFGVTGINVKNYSIVIWNRWGQIVFQSQDIHEIWDGKYGGKFCQPSVFGYKILAKSSSEQDYIFTGFINLLR
jgi:gliding motility-associated-like protein